jgi:hypothetical protein
MRNPQGHATIVGDLDRGAPTIIEGGLRHAEVEIDTFTCGHCNAIKHVQPRCDPADLGGLCKQCMELVCPRCYAKGTCVPWEKEMLRREAKDAALRSYGL